jgi:5S rRNA maturation endonuclease (ribonuclease M5)
MELIAIKRDILTICEGKRDVIALKKLGFTNIMELNAPLYAVVERVDKGETVQLLVDLDSEGKKLYATLSSDFLQRGVRIDNEIRYLLMQTGLQHIEGLDSYLDIDQ